MEILGTDEIKQKYGNLSWVSPYQKLIAMKGDQDDLIEIHEFHARGKCIGGSAWEVYHYPRVSDLIVEAKREGARNIFIVKVGECKLSLIPGIAGAGIEKVKIVQNEAHITYAGLGGGGIAATICRGLAQGVNRIEIEERGGGGKLGRSTMILPLRNKSVIGVDDTDEPNKGATWGLVNEISYSLDQKEEIEYLGHTIVQLYTQNPSKTTNCVSVAATFASTVNSQKKVHELFYDQLQKETFSDQTGMAISSKILITKSLREYARKVKSQIVDLTETEKIADKEGIQLLQVTGKRGLIGALAAIGYADIPDEAAKPYA